MNSLNLNNYGLRKAQADEWCKFVIKGCKSKAYIHSVAKEVYKIEPRADGKMSSIDVLAKLASYLQNPSDLTPKFEEAVKCLKGRVKSAHFSGFTGLIKRILAIFLSKYRFETSEKGQKFQSLEQKMASFKALNTQKNVPLKKDKVQDSNIAGFDNLKNEDAVRFFDSLFNAHVEKYPSSSIDRKRTKPIELKNVEVHSIFSPAVKEGLQEYAQNKGINEKDVQHSKEFQKYLTKLGNEREEDLDDEFINYAENSFLKFVVCWREIELLYKKENLSIINKFNQDVPERFRQTHEILLKEIQ